MNVKEKRTATCKFILQQDENNNDCEQAGLNVKVMEFYPKNYGTFT
jgi:hypothetical protein